MTDNEIKKALEICIMGDCEICSCRCGSVGDCRDALNKKSLDLINRQKAKIEGLQRLLYSFLDTRNGDLVRITNTELESIKKPIKAEAYKEFAERLKEKLFEPVETWLTSDVVREGDIDNLLKEMVGEDNESKN